MSTVLVTGSNRGIGLEFVEQLIGRGDRVLATCRNFEEADELRKLHMRYSDLHIFELDVLRQMSLDGFAAKLRGEPIDIFINNAGVYGPRDAEFGNIDGRTWADVFHVNAIAPFLLSQYLIENLRTGKAKKMVFLSSKMGSIADNDSGGGYIYRSSKSALNQVVKSLSIDLKSEGIVTAAIHPGWVLTSMGGPNALIDTQTSVSGMLKVIHKLGAPQSGKFYNYDGTEIAW